MGQAPRAWTCRKCEAPQVGGSRCTACSASRKLTGHERRKLAIAEGRTQGILRATALTPIVPPPCPLGVAAVVEWLNVCNATITRAIERDYPDATRIRLLQGLVKALVRGKSKENAPHRERLLQLRERHDGTPYRDAVTGDEAPSDMQALPLWHFNKLAALLHQAAHDPSLDEDGAKKYRALSEAHQAGLYARELVQSEALQRDAGVKDVHAAATALQRVWPVIDSMEHPAAPGTEVLFTSNRGPQTAFALSLADEVLYGGRAGGGKSAGLLIAALLHLLRFPDRRNHALILRRTRAESVRQSFYKMAEIALGALQRRGYGVQWRAQEHTWDLGELGKLEFGYLESMQDALRYQGSELTWLGLDEATHFDTAPMEYVTQTRMRSWPGVPALVRYATNPGGPNHQHFFTSYAPWLNRRPEYLQAAAAGTVPIAESGETLWYLMENGRERWVAEGTPGARSRMYLAAGIEDCPQYDRESYQRSLDTIRDPLLREQLQNGDWSAEYAAGEVFRRDWFKLCPHAPSPVRRVVRSYDLAWGTSDGACWTAGVLLGELMTGDWLVMDVIRLRGTWGTVQPVLRRVATIDRALYPSMVVRLPADMGAAGTIIRDSYVRELAGFNVELVPDRGDKFDRARPLAAQVQHGHVYLQPTSHPTRELAAELHAAGVEVSTAYQWQDGFLSELEKADPRFPKRGYLDQMDAFNGGFELLASDRLTELPAASAVTGARAAAARVWGSATGAAPGSSGGFGGGGLTLLRGGRAAAARRIA